MSRTDDVSSNSFQPAQPQRWSLFHGFAQAVDSHPAHQELRAWGLLAMASLGIAGIFALLLALSRLPGADEMFPWPVHFFEKGLVIHVVLSFVVWFLSILGAMCVLATYRLSDGWPRWRIFGPLSVWGSFAATVLLFMPAWMDRGEASLNNYVPVIIDPVYYAGLGVLGLSLLLSVIRLFVNLIGRKGPLEPVTLSTVGAGLIYIFALACFALAWLEIQGDASFTSLTPDVNEDLFWGGGHILQFLNVGLLLIAWYVLGGVTLGRPLTRPNLMNAAGLLLVLTSLAGPALFVALDAFSAAQTAAFTDLQYLLAPPTMLVAVAGIVTVFRQRAEDRLPWNDAAFHCLVLSVLVFATGGVLGLFVDGTDTRTPAHYHGVIGGINLAFMGLFFGMFLALLERGLTKARAAIWSAWLYASGQVFHSLGLFWAGGYGAPRKVAGAEQGIEALGATLGLYLMGIGAVIAVIGGVMFIVLVSKALLKKL
ncbi:MAG: cbb3-type cytochrome c oxidase subunit I [Rhodospirillales bacterium]|nr:cbb3-type cytochrome c oxidase subunit I [Alphaproteobacteria bacterium]MBL6947692.1 cbb3-type cytochrome c oxidase subunit I [Rhodospirillales bacterium]